MHDFFNINLKIDKRFFIILFSIIITLITFSIIFLHYDLQNIEFDSDPVVVWNENWNYKSLTGERLKINLPQKIQTKKDKTVVLTNTIPSCLPMGRTLCLRASIQSVKAYIDNQVIYEYGTDKSRYPGENAGSAWVLFKLPHKCEGKELKLEFSSSYFTEEMKINQIYLSSKSSILFNIIRIYGLNLFIALLIAIFGIVMIILHFFTNTQLVKNYSLIYLSLFSILVSAWILGESKTLQFFTGNQFIVSNLSFFAFYLFPLPMTLYIDTSYKRHHFRFAHWFFRLFLANFFICSILGIQGTFAFVDMVIPCQILLVIFAFTSLILLFYEYHKFNNNEALKIMGGIFILTFFGIIELYNCYTQSLLMASKFFAIGLLIFILYEQSITLTKIYHMNKKSIQSEYYKWLAYVDPITQGNNRTAFARDIHNFFDNSENCWLFIFDINDLKYINDNFGHFEGDNAIKRVYSLISLTFSPNGTTYRMGGDEFACILKNSSEKEAIKLSQEFLKNIKKENKNSKYPLLAPMGFKKYIPSKWKNFNEFFSYVDNKMYENKHKIKIENQKGK